MTITKDGAVRFLKSTLTPPGNVSAPPGSICEWESAPAGQEMWEKSTGLGTSGWALKSSASSGSGSWLGSLAALRALTSGTTVAVGDVRHVSGYATTRDGGEGSFANYGTSDAATDNDGTVIVDAAGRRWKRFGITEDWRLAWFGVLTTATAAQNATRVQAALNAASGATDYMGGATCFFGPGQYSVLGGITVPHNTRVKGLGTTHTLINHTGNNVLFESLQSYEDGRILMRREVSGMQIIGNSGAAAKAIHYGNFAHGARFEDLMIWQYTGGTVTAGGVGFHIENTVSFSEGLVLRDVQVRGCRVNIAMTKSGAGQASFSDPRFQNVLSVATGITGTTLYIGDGCEPYFGFWNIKLHLETANSVGIRLGPGSRIQDGLFNIGWEIWDFSAKTIQSTGAVEISGKGSLFPQISDGNGASAPLSDISNQTKLYIQDHPGDMVTTANPTNDVWWHIYDLPASSFSTFERLTVEMKGGPTWGAATLTHDKFMFQTRDGIFYRYKRSGSDPNASRAQMGIRAYEQSDGRLSVFVWAAAHAFDAAHIRAEVYGPMDNVAGGPQMTTLALKNSRQTVPTEVTTGTLRFDSSSSLYPPNWEEDLGYLYSNGKQLGCPRGAPTVSATGTGLGTGGSASVVGDNKSGYITLNAGTTPAINSLIATISFSSAYPEAPKTVMISPCNPAGAQNNIWPYVDRLTLGVGSFQLKSHNAALTPGTSSEWFYQVL